MLQDTYENRLHLRKTQINLVFHSIYTIFALRFAKRDCPRCKKNELLMKPKTKSALGDCCWAAYLKDGSLRENSPNSCYLHWDISVLS